VIKGLLLQVSDSHWVSSENEPSPLVCTGVFWNRSGRVISCWAIPCQFSGSGQGTLSNFFLKFYSNCHYPIWRTSAKFEWNLSRNGMIIKLFSWGGAAWGAQFVHIWPCLKPYCCQTTLVNNPNFSGMLVTLPNIEKITLSTLWL